MRIFVAVTDYDWFQVHAAQSSVEEVNFWQPSPDSNFKEPSPGEPLLFKLHSPRNFVAGEAGCLPTSSRRRIEFPTRLSDPVGVPAENESTRAENYYFPPA